MKLKTSYYLVFCSALVFNLFMSPCRSIQHERGMDVFICTPWALALKFNLRIEIFRCKITIAIRTHAGPALTLVMTMKPRLTELLRWIYSSTGMDGNHRRTQSRCLAVDEPASSEDYPPAGRARGYAGEMVCTALQPSQALTSWLRC